MGFSFAGVGAVHDVRSGTGVRVICWRRYGPQHVREKGVLMIGQAWAAGGCVSYLSVGWCEHSAERLRLPERVC